MSRVKGMRRWAPETTPSFWINQTSRLLMRHFEERLRPLGFGTAYLPVVGMLDDEGPQLQRDLALRAHVEQPTMAAILLRMERDGMVERTPHPTDKRASQVNLTSKARETLPVAMASLGEVAEQLLTGFTAEERTTFLALLQRAAKNLEPAEE